MNIQCPKCQFSQPKDHYCAKCGVDISKYVKKSSTKLKTLLINSAIPASLIIIVIISVNYKTNPKCPPVCKNNNVTYVKSDKKNTVELKKKFRGNIQNQKSQNAKKINQKIKVNRKLSYVKKTSLNLSNKIALSKKDTLKLQKINFKVDAQLVRFSKDLTNFIEKSSVLKIRNINNENLKNILIESAEVLSDFNEQDIKKAIKSLPGVSLTSKGLKLMVLNGHTKQPEKNTKLFFENLNLDLENIENNKYHQSFIAILINVH
ncbi:MAG: hypothetical protein HAW60_01945 [Bdellovibrionales bacterium]|nr:hypothetical protein [Bdellovibrionales bacterium]